MARIIGIGDIHEHPGPRNADRLRALDQIIDEGRQTSQLGAWVFAGDLFHAKSDAAGRNALDERIQRCADVAPVLIVGGNHDQEGDLDGFARLKASWPISVYTRPHVAVIRLATGEMAGVFCLPYPTKFGLVSAGIAPGDVVHTADALLDPIFMIAAAQLEASRDAGYLTFMVAHANIVGSISSTGQPQWGHEIEVSAAHLARLGPILKLFGHIHKPQEIAGAIYLGSVCRLDYAEIEEKRYVVATIAPDSSFSYVSMPIDVAPMHHVEGTLTRHGFVPDDQDAWDVKLGDWTGTDVRVRYRYQASERAVLDEALVRAPFVGALRLKIESVVIPDRELRSPEVAAAKTLPEKLAAYRKVAQLEPAIAEKLAQLQQQDPAVVLVTVASALAAIEQPQREVVVAA